MSNKKIICSVCGATLTTAGNMDPDEHVIICPSCNSILTMDGETFEIKEEDLEVSYSDCWREVFDLHKEVNNLDDSALVDEVRGIMTTFLFASWRPSTFLALDSFRSQTVLDLDQRQELESAYILGHTTYCLGLPSGV